MPGAARERFSGPLAGLLSCREEIGVARSNYLFTSESVSEGHPDKVSDRISDEVVDLYYRATIEQGLDVWALRCAAETLVTTNRVVIAGEFRGTDCSARAPTMPTARSGCWI